MLLSSMMMACAIGCYQANIPICISALLLFFIEYIYKKDIILKDYLFLALKNVIVLLLSVVWYIGMNYLVLKFRRETLSEYKGINSFGYESIDQYFRRILLSYKEFFFLKNGM